MQQTLAPSASSGGVVTNASFNPNTGLIEAIAASTGNEVADFTYGWDSLGNLTGRSDLNQSLVETFQYDILNRLTGYAIEGGAAKTVTYDDLGNIIQKSDTGTYTYPASGNPRPHAVASIAGALNTSYTGACPPAADRRTGGTPTET